MSKQKQWYIVYTHDGNELKTLHALKKKHIECFSLLNAAALKARDKNVIPLTNYLFVRVSAEEQAAIRRIEGVVNFMYWLRNCITVSKDDVLVLKELSENYQIITAERIKVNTTTPITKVWQPASANNEQEEQDLVKFSFPAYGFTITAQERKINVRVINIDINKSQQKTEAVEHSH